MRATGQQPRAGVALAVGRRTPIGAPVPATPGRATVPRQAAGNGTDHMRSVVTHPVVPMALATALPQEALSPTWLLVGAACSVIPDLDVVGFTCGISSHQKLGHRGLAHPIVFAAALGALLTSTPFRNSPHDSWSVSLYLSVSTLSHPRLDILTNGGHGVALFTPFSNALRWPRVASFARGPAEHPLKAHA